MVKHGRPKAPAFRDLPPAFPFRVFRVFRGPRARCGGIGRKDRSNVLEIGLIAIHAPSPRMLPAGIGVYTAFA